MNNDFIGSIEPRKTAFNANTETLEEVATPKPLKTEIVHEVKPNNKSVGFKPKTKIQYKVATFRLPADKIKRLQELSSLKKTSQAELINYALDKLFTELS